jgi:transposase InsO family protein
VDAEKANYPVRILCRVLEVSPSGFYDYLRRAERAAASNEEEALVLQVKAIHERTGGCYGSRRMSRELRARGCDVGRCQARTLMRKAGIAVRRRRRFRVTTDSRHPFPIAPNLLDRQFDPSTANRAWAADITYLWTAEGWLFLAVVIDLYSRRVVGWALAEHMRVALVTEALKMALWRRRPPPGLIHHSDRGSQYACHAYQDLLKDYGLVPSMSGKGDCWDNAPVERLAGSLKRERTDHVLYPNRTAAKADVIDYIEMFYNSQRRHSYLDYLSPLEYETKAAA